MWNGELFGGQLKVGFWFWFSYFFLFLFSWLNWRTENILVYVGLWTYNRITVMFTWIFVIKILIYLGIWSRGGFNGSWCSFQLGKAKLKEQALFPCCTADHQSQQLAALAWSPHRGQEWEVQEMSSFGLHPSLEGPCRLCWGADIVDRTTIMWMRSQSFCIITFSPGFKRVKIGFSCAVMLSKICWIQDNYLH